jgi:serine/threonine-protein kinase RsbW
VDKNSNIIIKNDINELKKIFRFIERFGKANGLSVNITSRLCVCADEIISNTIFHGYSDEFSHEIKAKLNVNNNRIVFQIEDDGVPFNLLNECTPDIYECAENRKIGGLGIHIVKNLMDQVDYKRENNKNIVTLSKIF